MDAMRLAASRIASIETSSSVFTASIATARTGRAALPEQVSPIGGQTDEEKAEGGN
jgi:hypothetical protein